MNIEELSKSTVQSYQTKAREAVRKLRKRGIFDPDHTPAEKAKIASKDKGLARASAKIAKAEAPSKEQLHSKLKDLHAKFDPEYQHSDDHSVYTKHAAIHAQIKDIKKKLGESEEVDEGILSKIANKIIGAAPEKPAYKVGQEVQYQTTPHQPGWKNGGKGRGKITSYSNGHYMIDGNPVNHFEIKKVHESEELDELSIDTLASYAGKARKEGAEASKKGARSKNLENALKNFRQAAKRHTGAAKAENKVRTKIVQKSWNEGMDEGVVVHTHKDSTGKEYQVLSRKNNREFVIQSKKKDGSWHTHDAVGTAQRAKQLITTGRYLNENLDEAEKVQVVSITLPALIRLCEIAREDIDEDTDLHEFIEAMLNKASGTIDSQTLEDIEGDGDSDEDDVNEQFVVLDHNKKQVHVAFSENAAKKKAEELSKSTGKPHTSTFKREAVVQVKEGEIVSADRKVGADGRMYPRSKKKLGDKTGSLTGMKS